MDEAARQWGFESNPSNEANFDPLVDLLMGAFAVESEKIWHEMESSRSRIVQRVIETLLPDTWTNLLPAHAILRAKSNDPQFKITPQTSFYSSGAGSMYFSSSGTFSLVNGSISLIAFENQVHTVTLPSSRVPLLPFSNGHALPSDCCWLGIELNDELSQWNSLCLFWDWPTAAERNRLLPYVPSIQFFSESGQPIAAHPGIQSETSAPIEASAEASQKMTFIAHYEQYVRDFYKEHFLTLTGSSGHTFRKYPAEWEKWLEGPQKALFQKDLCWIKMKMPAALVTGTLQSMEVSLNCFPVINRKREYQKDQIRPLFNVFGLTNDDGFWGIDRVINGDGLELTPIEYQHISHRNDVYSLRQQSVARFDRRNAFELLTDVAAKMRDDLAAFDAMGSDSLSGHLTTINRELAKINEHLARTPTVAPTNFLTVRTKSAGKILEVFYWVTPGQKGNGLPKFSKLTCEQPAGIQPDTLQLLTTTVGGRNKMEEYDKRDSFREAFLTRGKIVTAEDFATLARSILKTAAKTVSISKRLDIGELPKHGLRRILEIIITPNPAEKHAEEFWFRQSKLVKTTVEKRATGVLPVFVSVIGYEWKV